MVRAISRMDFRIGSALFLCVLLAVLSLPARAALPSFDKVFEQHSAVMVLIDPATGAIVDANDAASRFYGYSRDQLRAMSIQQINTLTPEEVAAERQLAAKEDRNFFVFRHRLANQDIRTVKVASVPYTFDERMLLFSIIYDITDLRETQDALWHYQTRLEQMVERQSEDLRQGDQRTITLLIGGSLLLLFTVLLLIRHLWKRKQAERLLQLEQKRLEEIIRGTNVGTWEWNIQTGETVFNERWANIVGYSLEELQPVNIDTWTQLAHPEDLARSGRVLEKVFSGELSYYEIEARMKHKSGDWIWVLDRGKVVEWSEQGAPIRMSGTHQDITQRKADQQQVEYLAKYDTLTGLPNRTLFFDRCAMALATARRTQSQVALLFVDLDDFKPINDTRGHDAGDQVLQQVANRLMSSVREMDSVARFGGDEFVVLLSGISSHAPVSRIARQIIDKVSEPYELVGGEKVSLSCSIGIALYPDDGTTTAALIRNADIAMYTAKREEKGSFIYASDTPDVQETERAIRSIESPDNVDTPTG